MVVIFLEIFIHNPVVVVSGMQLTIA